MVIFKFERYLKLARPGEMIFGEWYRMISKLGRDD
jgi:hypothetical protein